MKSSRKISPRRLQFETLEAREVMAAGITASLSSGVLTVNGNDSDNAINFKQTSGKISIVGVSGSWAATKVNSIVVDLRGGNDTVSLNSLANGGKQALAEFVTVKAGAGNDKVRLVSGQEVNFSGTGNTLSVAANGTSASMNGIALNLANTPQISFSGGVLTIFSSNASDTFNFRQANGWIGIQGRTEWWSADTIQSIVVNLQEGSDSVSLDSISNGGNQQLSPAFTINSGFGNQTVRLVDGYDVDFSGWGHQVKVNTAGVATLDGQAVNVPEEIQAVVVNGVLTITGTSTADDIKLLQANGWIGIQGRTAWWSASSITSIVVHLRGGDDALSIDSLSNGGNQAFSVAFTVNSGGGNETVRLANGYDVNFSGTGHQLTVSSTGTAALDGQVLNFGDPNPPTPPDPPTPPVVNWFDTNIQDAALRTLGHDLYLDGLIDRADVIALLNNTKDGGAVDGTELADLRNIAATATLFGSQASLQKLTNYVVNVSAANAKYLGATLGNLVAGSADAHLEKLVNKWFFGLDRPVAGGAYREFAGQLFVNGATYDDIHQGAVGDCYFVMSLAEVALRSPATITNMFVVNGDGTYTVKFYNPSGQAEYITVDSYLPTDGNGRLIYASRGSLYTSTANELWVALAEKAYAQLNEFGWSRAGFSVSGQNSYTGIANGYIYAGLNHVTGLATTAFAMTNSSGSFNTFVSAFNAGKMIGFASYASPPNSGIVGNHAYAVVGYNATNQTITLFNPWGVEYGLVTMTWSQIQQNFWYFDRTA